MTKTVRENRFSPSLTFPAQMAPATALTDLNPPSCIDWSALSRGAQTHSRRSSHSQFCFGLESYSVHSHLKAALYRPSAAFLGVIRAVGRLLRKSVML